LLVSFFYGVGSGLPSESVGVASGRGSPFTSVLAESVVLVGSTVEVAGSTLEVAELNVSGILEVGTKFCMVLDTVAAMSETLFVVVAAELPCRPGLPAVEFPTPR
jgi:hypothetical protein